ncbi:CHAT domain-containing tetratricopeptide repeat protein [Phormidium sp. FACHB-1136]|uniref:CHAT domain-containing tetratricopeptide repeat protein n=1 Tax=Phormidium sp. FACHB-1136 TaxID=2692848 RepID=UPI001689A286|nr:CHAT domain-containing tetratricopeptide repeat protein [Phormidium sp. FACHB-1136]MBD2428162.1 tetratricopeptide repeat protein [Phormidium sp. FACHB-1136]
MMSPSRWSIAPMRQAAKWLGLVALTTVLVPFAGNPGFFKETRVLMPAALAQSTEARKAEADRLLDQGVEQYNVSQFREALQSWEQALAIYRDIQDRGGEGAALGNLGNAYDSLGDYHQAIDFQEQALTIFREIGDRSGEGSALGNLGATYNSLGDYRQAIDFHEQSLAIAREIDNRGGEGAALGNLGNAYLSLGDYRQAIDFHEQALTTFRELGDRGGEGTALGSLGNAYLSLGDYRQAIDFHEQRLVIARELGDRGGEGGALGNLGLAYDSLGDYRQAIDFQDQALTIFREIGDRGGEGGALANLGNAYDSLGNYRQAIDFHEQALTIFREIGDRRGEGSALGNLGATYNSLGDYRRAIDFYEQHLVIAREIGDRGGEGNALGNLGNAYDSLGDYRQAIDFQEQRLAIAREIGDRRGEGGALGNLGVVYDSLGDYRQAIDFQEQSLVIAREIGDRGGEGKALGNLGNAYRNLGDYRQAIDFYEQSLAIAREIGDRRGEGAALGSLGNAYRNLGDYRQAIDFQEQHLVIARELGDRRGEGAALANLGVVYGSLGDYRQAIDFYEQHLAIAREIGDRSSEGSALNNLGFAYLKTEQFALAETALAEALDVWDALRDSDLPDANKISLFEIQRVSFLSLQRALVAQNKVGPALEVAERGRGRAFAELLSQRLSSEEVVLDAAPPQLGDIKALAQEQQTTLITYSVIRFTDEEDDDVLHIWVVSPTGDLTFRRQPLDDVDLASLVTTARQSLGVRGDRFATAIVELTPDALARQQAETEANLRQLYDVLIAPITDLLPADTTQPVVFMPQDELFLVPFAALKAPDGQYLIENHTILTSPSIQVFGLATEANSRPNGGSSATHNPLIVGNPTMPTVTFLSEGGSFQDVQLSPLPGAQREAVAISGFLQTPALLGSEATKTAVQQRMAGADVIHLATHGLLEYGDPQQTGTRGLPGAIALAPGSGEDGLLTAAEILQMDLRADLAVLSACDTGRGRITGDGVIGLSRAFVAAGVPSIIVSLWAVDDQATADLMVAFYDNWQQSGDKAQALRQAMLTTMEQHPDPRLWSAFTLIGSPN